MVELLAQTYVVPHAVVEYGLAGLLLLAGVVWTSQVRKVTRIDNKVKGLAVALLFLVRNCPACTASGGPDAEANKNAIRALTDVLRM